MRRLFKFDAAAPAVVSVEINAGLSDPPDLPEGPQPTSWMAQRSELRTLVVTFDEEVFITAADLQLTNLGVNAPADPDVVVPLTEQQFTIEGDTLTISFDSHALDDGVYELQILPTVTDLVGFHLDGNDDGVGGDPHVFTGSETNTFYQLAADFNGDLGVSIFDWPSFSYWFGKPVGTAPQYVDLNQDGGVSIFDWPTFLGSFGRAIVFSAEEGLQGLGGRGLKGGGGNSGVVIELVPDTGYVSSAPDGTKTVTVRLGTTIGLSPRIIESPSPVAGFQLNFSDSDFGDGQLLLDSWTTAADWPMETDGALLPPNDTLVAAATLSRITVPPARALGTLVVVAPGEPGDYMLSLDADGTGAFSTGFVGTLGTLPVSDLGALVVRVVEPLASVVDRHVFYNNSSFDGDDASANGNDDDAIAPDKEALLPGKTASFANYTSYSRGINGIIVDIAGLVGTPTADDFVFRVGNVEDPIGWSEAPGPASITMRPGEGIDGSDRVTITWPDGAVIKQWLQVTIVPTAATGLAEPDVFYFGNAVGDGGDSLSDAKVNATDMLLARNNPRIFLNPAEIDFAYDFNRDGRVNATDMLLARNNPTSFIDALKLITAPGDASPIPRPDPTPSEVHAPSVGMSWLSQYEHSDHDGDSSGYSRRTVETIDRLLTSGWL